MKRKKITTKVVECNDGGGDYSSTLDSREQQANGVHAHNYNDKVQQDVKTGPVIRCSFDTKTLKVVFLTSVTTSCTFLIVALLIGLVWFPKLWTSSKNPYQYQTKHGPNELVNKDAGADTSLALPHLWDIYESWIKYQSGNKHVNNGGSSAGSSSQLYKKIVNTRGSDDDVRMRDLESAAAQGTQVLLRGTNKRAAHINLDVEAEALASLNLAIEMKLNGKLRKASKLFQHALNLDPSHSDILNAYGEFLEQHQHDVVKAELMYTKALIHSPSHGAAAANRRRTLPLVEELDRANFARIDKKRHMLYSVPDGHPALRRAKQESYFQHVHHTTAIEGNSLSLMEIRYIIESGNGVAGKSIMEHNEVVGMDRALAFINSTMLHRIGSITLQDILEIHRRVLGWVDPLSAGIIRSGQVYVGDFKPPPAGVVWSELEELVQWINSDDAQQLHPIELAALTHYRLVYIHPFIDGNGRTARLLMNVVLMQAGFPPVIIRLQDRLLYYDTLREANDGDIRPFIRFVARCTERTLNWFLHTTNVVKLEATATGAAGQLDTIQDGGGGGNKMRDRVIVIDNYDDDDDGDLDSDGNRSDGGGIDTVTGHRTIPMQQRDDINNNDTDDNDDSGIS